MSAPSQPSHSAAADLLGGTSFVPIPDELQDINRRYRHQSDISKATNALYFFHKQKREEKEKIRLRRVREARRQETEQKRTERELNFPCRCFVLCDGEDETKVRGSVVYPGEHDPASVEGFILGTDPEDVNMFLLVVYTLSGDRYFPIYCSKHFLPRCASKKRKKKGKGWLPVEFSCIPVETSGGGEVMYITKGPFKNRTCDKSMMVSLESGLVVSRDQRRISGNKRWYSVLNRSFDAVSILEPSEVYLMELVHGIMTLSNPARMSDVPRRIRGIADAVREGMHGSNLSLTKALDSMEEWCCESEPKDPSEYERCLQVAFCGRPTIKGYGRFIPCPVLGSQKPFPNGSFSVTPCGCNLARKPGIYPDEVNDSIRKMTSDSAGHNYRSRKKA